MGLEITAKACLVYISSDSVEYRFHIAFDSNVTCLQDLSCSLLEYLVDKKDINPLRDRCKSIYTPNFSHGMDWTVVKLPEHIRDSDIVASRLVGINIKSSYNPII